VISRYSVFSLYLPAMTLALGSTMIAPALPVLARSFEVSFGEASLAFVVHGIGQIVSSIPTGYLIDRIGRRKLLLAGPVLLALTSVGTGLSQSFGMLVAMRFLAGVGQQMWMLSRMTVIADTGAESQRGRQMMGMVSMEASGRLLGPVIGGFLAAGTDIRAPFFLHAALCLLSIAPSFWMIKESMPQRSARRVGAGARAASSASAATLAALLTWPVMMFFMAQLLANLTRGTSMSGALHLYAVYAFNVGPDTVGLLASGASLVGLPIIFSTGYIMDRFGRTATVVPGFALTGVAMGVMAAVAWVQGPFSAYAPAYLALMFAQSLTAGNMQVIGSLIAPEHVRGRFFGVWRVVGEGGSAASPAVFALVAEHVSYGASFAVLSACSLGAALVLASQVRVALKRLNRPPQTDAEAPAGGSRAGV
jgi:MFS family permease